MRKLVLLFSCVCVIGLFLTSFLGSAGQERLHPSLRALLARRSPFESTNLAALAPKIQVFGRSGMILFSQSFLGSLHEEGERIGVLVKVRRRVWSKQFLGFPVRASTGTILTMAVTLKDLLFLADSPEVIYVEPAWRTRPKLDQSLPAIGVDRVHAKLPPVLGKGVILGAVDTGIDYTHLDFRYDTDGDGFEESSRILFIWDQTSGFLGRYYTRREIESDLALGFAPGEGTVQQTDTDGHGTHVMGVAAGDGSSSSAGFVGVAPRAQLIIVKTPFYTSDILSGVAYIFDRAEELGLPAIVNLSLGGHEGPHDGTSLFEQGLDELAQGKGRVIVVSAGNEGDQAIHVSRTLRGGNFAFTVNPSTDFLDLGLWYPGGSRFAFTITPPAGTSLVASPGSVAYAVSASGNVYVDNASAGTNPNNGDNEVLISLSNVIPGSPWRVTIRDDGGGGRFDGWITSGEGTILEGDSLSTIDEPGNGIRVITVGAFNTKARWPALSGGQDFSTQYPIGDLSYFSSQGPTRDGRQKPELTAPGAWVAAALSTDSPSQEYLTHPDGTHTMLAGTSVSAPHVSGVAALMLSVAPDLTSDEIKSKLTQTAISDALTGRVPNTKWGWGKLAADAAVAVVELPSDGGEAKRPGIAVSENPVRDRALFVYLLPEETTMATLRIYNIAGRLFFETALAVGENEYEWNLATNMGDPLGSGLYLYVLSTEDGRSEIGRLVIAR